MRRDLFDDEQSRFLSDPALLERLATEKLEALAGTVERAVDSGPGGALYDRQNLTETLSVSLAPTFSLGVAFTTVALLGSIGFLAGFFPSRRAVTIQPAVALRYE